MVKKLPTKQSPRPMTSLIILTKYIKKGVGEMAQWFSHSTLAEDSPSI